MPHGVVPPKNSGNTTHYLGVPPQQAAHSHHMLSATQANRVVSQPTVGYGGTHSESQPLQSYAESLDTEYDSECSSEHSEDNFDMDYITTKGRNILSRCGDLLTEFVDLSCDWKTLIRKMHREMKFCKDYKAQIRDLMAQVALFDERIMGINRIHNENIDEEKVHNEESDDQSETEDGEEEEEHEHIEDYEDGKETEGGKEEEDEVEEEEDEVEEEEDHGKTCFKDIVLYFEYIVNQHPWAKQTYDRIKIQGRTRNHFKDESESSQQSDSDNEEEEREIREEPVSINKLIDMKNTIGKFLEGVKYEGNAYLKNVPKKK